MISGKIFGTVIHRSATVNTNKGDKPYPFLKRSFILEEVDDNDGIERVYEFTLKQKECRMLDDIREGFKVNVEYALAGRRGNGTYNDRVFNDLMCLKIDIVDDSINLEKDKIKASEKQRQKFIDDMFNNLT